MIAGGVTTLDYWMLSRPEMKTAEQLKGDAVAISRFGRLPTSKEPDILVTCFFTTETETHEGAIAENKTNA